MRKYLLIIVGFVALMLQAQTNKNITLSDKVPFSDTIATFLFNEDANTVTITLNSGRKMFVFWEDIKYNKAFSCRRLRTDRLSYALSANTSDQFHSAPKFRHSLPKHHGAYIFHAWFTAEEMDPCKAERKIVNDSITQIFSVAPTCMSASIRLRDVLFIDEVKQKGIKHYYELSFGGDVNTLYTITLQRNPCIGLDMQIQAAENAKNAIQQSYASFKGIFDKGIVNSEEGEQLFHDLQNALQTQFPMYQDSSACPAIQQAYMEYNQYIDSIQSLSVTLQTPAEQAEERSLNTKTVLANARLLDSNVARWLVTNDKMEKSDLVEQCKSIIIDTEEMIKQNGTRTSEERNAAEVFRKAVQYFKRTCR